MASERASIHTTSEGASTHMTSEGASIHMGSESASIYGLGGRLHITAHDKVTETFIAEAMHIHMHEV